MKSILLLLILLSFSFVALSDDSPSEYKVPELEIKDVTYQKFSECIKTTTYINLEKGSSYKSCLDKINSFYRQVHDDRNKNPGPVTRKFKFKTFEGSPVEDKKHKEVNLNMYGRNVLYMDGLKKEVVDRCIKMKPPKGKNCKGILESYHRLYRIENLYHGPEQLKIKFADMTEPVVTNLKWKKNNKIVEPCFVTPSFQKENSKISNLHKLLAKLKTEGPDNEKMVAKNYEAVTNWKYDKKSKITKYSLEIQNRSRAKRFLKKIRGKRKKYRAKHLLDYFGDMVKDDGLKSIAKEDFKESYNVKMAIDNALKRSKETYKIKGKVIKDFNDLQRAFVTEKVEALIKKHGKK